MDVQTQNEVRLLLDIRTNVGDYARSLKERARAAGVRAEFEVELTAFADNVVTEASTGNAPQNIGHFLDFCRQHHELTLALFCARYIFSRPLKKMEFDCRGDVVTTRDSIVIRQLEFKRADVEGGVTQVFEHIAAEIAAVKILDPGRKAFGKAIVLVLDGAKPTRPRNRVSSLDADIELVTDDQAL